MTPSIEKLRHLWRNRASVFAANPEFTGRVDRIFAIVEHWEGNQAAIQEMAMQQTPDDAGIPTNDWPTVKQNFLNTYNGLQRNTFGALLDQVEALLHIASRRFEFRISSNAGCDSAYETKNTTSIAMNPESYYASFNWPFEISKCYLAIGPDQNNQLPPLCRCTEEKFVRKFLWMLAKRNTIVPILSLASYYELAPLFHLDQQIVAQIENERWALTLPAFTDPWTRVSSTLSQEITGCLYSDLSSDKKQQFAKLLFIASLTETTTKNALDMLKTGCQAQPFKGATNIL